MAILPLASFGQGFSHLLDFDSTADHGWHVFVEPTGDYFLFGEAINGNGPAYISNMEVSFDGSTILSRHSLTADMSQIYSTMSGQAVRLHNGEYLLPVTVQSGTTPIQSAAGLAKFNLNGDTIFVKAYTDTSLYFEYASSCTELPNGDYLLGSTHQLHQTQSYPSRIIRTDSNGNIKWSQSYQKIPSQFVTINTLQLLDANRILVGAMSTALIVFPLGYVPHNAPWFFVIDSMGNVVKDTVFGEPYWGGGSIWKDFNGGYYHVGWIDSFPNQDPSALEDAPGYIAHLDTNFQIEWITRFNFTDTPTGKRYISTARQLQDGNFILVGESYDDEFGWSRGWCAKVNQSGAIVWNHNYYLNPHYDNELWDVVERSDRSILLVGDSFNDTLPSWRGQKDIWLVSVDSNGCIIPGCDNGLITTIAQRNIAEVKVYPNPNTGYLILETGIERTGHFYLYDLLGQFVASYPITNAKTEIHIGLDIAPGVYIGRFAPSDGSGEATVRIVYENQ